MSKRDEFSKQIKETLAKRVGYRCSNPICRKATVGPKQGDEGAMTKGVASHITAAAPGGPRYCSTMSEEERSSIDNGIWLCSDCALLVDKDENAYTVTMLKQWKFDAEKKASDELMGVKTGSDATCAKISVKDWLKAPKPETLSKLDIMFIQSGGVVKKGDRWLQYIDSIDEWQRPYVEALREEIVRKRIKWTGKEMQEQSRGVPVFNNGKFGLFTCRAWGDLMAATWAESENIDYTYLDFYL